MITEERAEQAIRHLADTDEAYAAAKSRVKALEYQLKVQRAQAFLGATGTVAEREARAHVDSDYCAMINEYENAVLDMETLGAKRERERLVWEHFRTISANRRVGG